MWHGTKEAAALKICKGGFAALSLLDAGWFGKGIYFTDSVEYTTKVYRSEVMVLCWVVMMNVYPVVYSDMQNLYGK